MQPTHARIEQVAPEETPASDDLPPVPLKMARNFYVTDTYLETPHAGVAPTVYERNEPSDLLAPFNGLSAVSPEIAALLPPECRQAFDTALQNEQSWKSRWGPESEKSSRREPVIDKAIVPYSVS